MTVAIISEYNPFHSGHKYHIDAIRKEFGEETKIVAVMSGNFTQRGEIAIADKYLRAEWATLAGVDLVLELPFPYSVSSAEIFAKAAIKIIDSIKIADYISFGSELGNADRLFEVARNMQTELYKEQLKKLLRTPETKPIGYPRACELAYKSCFFKDLEDNFFSPNNILAVEYIKAILSFKSNLKVHTVKRIGADYSQNCVINSEYQSAMALRSLLKTEPDAAIKFIPEAAKNSFYENLGKTFPTDTEKLASAIISHFRLSQAKDGKNIFDSGQGLYERIRNASFEAKDISELISLTETKKFTNARIRREIWYAFFGVTSSTVKELPKFTQVLAFNEKGRALLKSIKERSKFHIITKPSAYAELPSRALRQKMALDRADTVFQLTKPSFTHGKSALLSKPFVKK